MTLLLGVDTGGTYTDAVLMRDDEEVLASAKALTTRHDLAEGIGKAVGTVLETEKINPLDISMVSMSTTLATNALVEGQAERVALICVGFTERNLDTHDLRKALKGDPVLLCAGGHDHAGEEAVALDTEAVRAFVERVGKEVTGFAVAAQFATRNPDHEMKVAALIRDITGRPVSASHELSARLNGPKRAMTALLNARLIGMIDRLIGRSETKLRDLGIAAPIMVVRGDGALISADQARAHPIETILSGPAASIVGARWLTGASDALVSDIGGTTTDVALLRDGRPAIDPAGAQVGGYRTMVEAVAMRTTGLGGDSEVDLVGGLAGGLILGPRRVLPVSLIAMEAPALVHETLDRQLRSTVPGEHDARFIKRVAGVPDEGLGPREAAVLNRLEDEAQPATAVLRSRVDEGALTRLIERGLVQVAGVTPSDASHVLGWQDDWDSSAAEKALRLFARKRSGAGTVLAHDAQTMARKITDQLQHQTALALLEAAFEEEEADFGQSSAAVLARHPVIQRALAGHRGVLRLDAALNVPVIGLGASARTYYPAIGQTLGCPMVLPDHADVANAIGAVVGRVRMRCAGTVTSPGEGKYRAHLASGPVDFADCNEALSALEQQLRQEARERAVSAGAADIQFDTRRDIRHADVEARNVFVEARIEVEAAGRPRIATG